MGVQIHFRSDNWSHAQMRFKGTAYGDYMSTYATREEFEATPLPVPGDIWAIHWYKGPLANGPLAGYAICCPKCGDIHQWTTATNCSTKVIGSTCTHVGAGSCWEWTGSAEQGTLTAHPSLLCHTCGYHGWLKNGVLTEC